MSGKTILCTVAFNTPILMDVLIKSIEKHIPSYHLYVFDNGSEIPFHTNNENVTIFDNTRGQIINFDKWLENFPNRKMSYGARNGWGSAKHCYTIQKCIEMIGKPFFLLDSDVIIKKDFSSLADEKCVYVGEPIPQDNGKIRIAPFLCYINSPKCRLYGIKYFDPAYMHGLKCEDLNPEADLYDTGCAFYIHTRKYRHSDISINDYISHFKNGSWKDNRGKAHKYTLYEWLDANKEYFMSDESSFSVNEKIIHGNKKVVYTCITGGYDTLHEIKHEKGWDYICFTDRKNLESKSWTIKPLPAGVEMLTNVKKQRYVKLNPHIVVPEYETSVWIDGNILAIGSVEEFYRMIPGDKCMAFKIHPIRRCVYDEIKECAKRNKDKIENMCGFEAFYRLRGYPAHNGLYETNVIVRRHNEPTCIHLMKLWTEDVLKGSHRDQLSINYRVWEQGYRDFIYEFRNDICSMYFQKIGHAGNVLSLQTGDKEKNDNAPHRGNGSFFEKLG